jgi:hypothetical protein
MEEVKPLLARIQELKGGREGVLSGTQLMAFFLQRRVQPLQHRLSKLWTFSGLEDPSRVSEDLMEKKDLDKGVRALTTLTKDHEVVDLAASYFDSEHPLPAVCFTIFYSLCFSLIIVSLVTLGLFSFQDHRLLVSRPPLPEGGAIPNVPVSAASEAPEDEVSQDGTKAKIRWKGPAQRRHLLLCFLKILALTRRGSASKSSLPRVPPLIKL